PFLCAMVPPPTQSYPLSLPTLFRSLLLGLRLGLLALQGCGRVGGKRRPQPYSQQCRQTDAPHQQLAFGLALGGHRGHGRLDLVRSEEHTSELQSRENLVCRLLLEKK